MRPSLSPVPVTRPSYKHLQQNRTFQGIPGLMVTPAGRIFALWYAGGSGECGDNYVTLCISDDHGQTWSDSVAVIDPAHPNVRAYDATMWVAPDHRVFLFWAQTMSCRINDIFDGKAGVWYSILENPESSPQDFRWTAPVRICDGVMMNKPIVLTDGVWALPVAVWNWGEHPGAEDNIGAKMWISDDHGETFRERGKCRLPKEISIYDEHSFVEMKDGRIKALIRVTYGNAETFSCDKGMTWSQPVPSGIIGPCSRLFLRRLKSGRLLLVGHDCPPRLAGDKSSLKRERLTAWLSDDDGASWYGRLLLDEREQVSYPDGQEHEDGTIYVVHDHGRYDGAEILVSIITEDDIAAGKLVTAGSRLRVLVSKTAAVAKQAVRN